jgi:hypothetical protein
MDIIEELVRFSNENETVDFKAEEYRKETFGDLVKDVLAFCNANVPGNRYIIMGVKKEKGEPVITPVEPALDAASIQQLIHENIYPEVRVDYDPYKFDGNNLMVLTIHEPGDQPYMAIKDYNKSDRQIIKKHQMLIRKGGTQLLISRHDLDRIYKRKFQRSFLDGKIELTFEDGKNELEIECVRNIELPSDREKAQILEQIEFKEDLLKTDAKLYTSRYANSFGGNQSYSEMSLPNLRANLQTVKRTYSTEDNHYLYETRAYKLNLIITNHGEMHLDKAMVILSFPIIDGLKIMHTLMPTLYQVTVPDSRPRFNYPKITAGKENVEVEQRIGEVRHKLPVTIFETALRIYVGEELAGQTIPIFASVYASNLTKPYQTELLLILN